MLERFTKFLTTYAKAAVPACPTTFASAQTPRNEW
jgi:hypothetical protein